MHYTTAEAAVSIIKNAVIWMRKSSTMNDFLEIQYGIGCLKQAYESPAGQRFREAVTRLAPDVISTVEARHNSTLDRLVSDSYVTSFSEHGGAREDQLGRLSMWRAYGNSGGVALILRNTPFMSVSDALHVYSSPVAYLDRFELAAELNDVAARIEQARSLISTLPAEVLVEYIATMFRFAVLCTKHPGFEEEREWRAVFTPSLQSSERVPIDVEVIRGTPQPVAKIRLKSYPDEGLVGMELSEVLDRVVVGPTQYPHATREAYIRILSEAGVQNPESRVFISSIPLRL